MFAQEMMAHNSIYSETGAKRLAFYCSSIAWGGLEMNFVRYAAGLSEAGWEVFVCCVQNSHIHLKCDSFHLQVVFIERNRKYFDIRRALKVRKLFRLHGISICWFTDNRDVATLGWTKFFSGNALKLAYFQQMQLASGKKDIVHRIRFAQLDVWMSPLPFLARQVREMTSVAHERIYTVPLGADEVSLLANASATASMRAQCGIPEDAFVAGVIGRIDPLKGQHVAIAAVKELLSAGKKMHLLIVGESTLHEGTGYEEQLKKSVADSGLDQWIHFAPFTNNVALFYNSIDVMLMCSKGETFGMVTIEAMAFGKPVIGTNSSGTPEILDNGRFGLLFEPGDHSQLASQIQSMMDEPLRRQAIGKAARAEFFSRYTMKVSIGMMDGILKKLQ